MLSKLALVVLATSTANAYVRPSSWQSTYEKLFKKPVTDSLLKKIDAEIDDFEADGGVVTGEKLHVKFEEALEAAEEAVQPLETLAHSNLLEAALSDGGQRARGGKREKRKKKKRGRKPKKPEGEKYEYSVQSDDHSVPIEEPTGRPVKGRKSKAVAKILTALKDEPCMENCVQYCVFDDVESNVQHEPCRKCARNECLSEIKAIFGGKPGKGDKGGKGKRGKGGKGGKGGKRRRKNKGENKGENNDDEDIQARAYGYGGGYGHGGW